jgi:hypothetical protein
VTDDTELKTAISENAERIQAETLTLRLAYSPVPDVEAAEREVAEQRLRIFVSVAD